MKSLSRIFPDRASRSEWTAWAGLVTAGIGLRVSLLLKFPDLWFCSDEANLGLMAMHLLRSGKAHFFIAGEAYGGVIEVLAIALGTLLTGSPFLGIKIAALAFFTLFAAVLFLLAKRLFNRSVGLISVALVSLSPSFLTNVTIRNKGPYAETLFFGTLLMYLTIRLADEPRPTRRLLIAWGVVAGLGWYTYYLAAMFIIPCILFLALNRMLFQPRLVLTAGAGALAGSLPYWIFAIKYRILPPWGQKGLEFFDPVTGLKNFFLIGLPIITGGRWSFYRDDLVPGISKLVLMLYVLAVIAFVGVIARKREPLRSGKVLIVLHLGCYPFLFAFSRFAWFADEPRYLVGLYASLPIVLSWLVVSIWHRSRVIAGTLILMPILLSVYASYRVPPWVFNTIFAEPNQAIIRFLEDRNIKHFYANYWIVYRLMFETEERFIGANYFSVVVDRYPAFKQEVDADPTPAYIAWPSEAESFEKSLQETGRAFRVSRVGQYVVFLDIAPRLPPLP